MFLVTGATGTTGRLVAKGLLERGHEVRVLVRDPARALELEEAGASVVMSDLGRPNTVARALVGIQKAYLVVTASPTQVELNHNFFAAARGAGLTHVVRLSVIGADAESPIELARLHARSDQELRDSGIAWTIVRPHSFMQNFLMYAPGIQAEGAFYAPMGNGTIPMIDARDIAEVLITALTHAGHEDKVYTLTGPQALSFADAAFVISRVCGREVRYVDVRPEVAKQGMLAAGMDPWLVDNLLRLYAVFSRGLADAITGDVGAVLGHDPTSFERFVQDHSASFCG